ncbi:MAG TPA: hypothetical protein VK420_15250, partial [Longimicrobium sp.]|nr:hypothetical protein [Longimicrobium sp.]
QGESDDFSDLFGSAPAPGAPAAPAAADGLFSAPTRQAPPSAVPAAPRPPQKPSPGASLDVTLPGRPPSPAPSAGLEPGLDGAFDFGGPPDAPASTGKGLLSEVPPAGTDPFQDPFAAPPGSLPRPSASPSTGANPAAASGPGPDRGLFDMPSAPPSVGPVDPFGLGSSSPAPELPAEPPSASVVIGKMKLGGTPQVEGGTVGPVVEVSTGVVDPGAAKPPSTARRLSGVVVNIAIAAGLVLVLATVVGVYRNEGKLEASAFTPERVKALFVTTTDRVAVDVSNGLYETQQGRPIFYVRGEVENRGRKGGRVRVRAEILDGSQLVRAAEGYAGTSPTPEELYTLQSAQDVESLVARLDKGAADVAPGKRAPFLLAFYEYPGELAGLRLKVTVLDGDAQPSAP